MAVVRKTVSIRLALVDALRDIVGKDQSPTARLFDSERASRAVICERALEVAGWVASGQMYRDISDGYAPEFEQRLDMVDRTAFIRGVQAAANFLGAVAEIDPERGIITLHPPAEFQDIDIGEIDAKSPVEHKSPRLH